MQNRKEIVLCSVGDLMLSDSPLFVGVGVGTAFPVIKDKIFNQCSEDLTDADISIGNFETVVYHPKHKNLAELQMSCSEETITIVKKAGFNILNLANNHCLQHGTDAFFYTKKTCENLGIGAIGVRDEKPYICEVKGQRFAFFSLCIHTEWYQPDDIRYEDNIDRVLKKIEELHKTEPNIVITLAVHWGDEFATFPTNAQIELAHKFVDKGTSIILGHHSHVFQGIERYKDALIVYGQGNFVSDMVPRMCRETGIVKISISIENGKRDINFKVLPFYINDSLIPEASDGEWFVDRQKELENALNGQYSDEDYWRVVNAHHKTCSNDFRVRFRKSFYMYRWNIFVRMMYEFVIRKIKKIRNKKFMKRKGL